MAFTDLGTFPPPPPSPPSMCGTPEPGNSSRLLEMGARGLIAHSDHGQKEQELTYANQN